MLQRKGSPGNYVVKCTDLFAAGYVKWTGKYPLLEGPLNWLKHHLRRDPFGAGASCSIVGEARKFRVAKTPLFGETPGFRVMYEIDEADYIVILWNMGSDPTAVL